MPNWLLLATAGLAFAQVPRLWSWVQRFTRPPKREGEPLSRVVARCEAKWFLEELQLAMEGSGEAMAHVGHMLLSGYGVRQDPSEAARWLRQAWAIQNFKEHAMADMMDLAESPVPKLSSRFEQQRQRKGRGSRQQAMAGAADISSFSQHSSGEASQEHVPQLDAATAYNLVAMAQAQLQQERAAGQQQILHIDRQQHSQQAAASGSAVVLSPSGLPPPAPALTAAISNTSGRHQLRRGMPMHQEVAAGSKPG